MLKGLKQNSILVWWNIIKKFVHFTRNDPKYKFYDFHTQEPCMFILRLVLEEQFKDELKLTEPYYKVFHL